MITTRHYEIKWSAEDPDGDPLTINLYRNTIRNVTGMIPIEPNLTNDVQTYIWDTSSVPNGSYFIYSESNDGNGNIVSGTYYDPNGGETGTFLLESPSAKRYRKFTFLAEAAFDYFVNIQCFDDKVDWYDVTPWSQNYFR